MPELRCEIESIVEGYAEKAISVAREVFDIANEGEQNTLECAKAWSMCFGEETVALSELDNACRAVLDRARGATEGRYTESSFVLALSSILLGKGFDKWDDASPREFAEQLRETVAKLERTALESEKPSELLLPLLGSYFHRLYGQFERMLGPNDAAEKIRELLEEKEKTYIWIHLED